ncbi:hypothetical protein [Rhodopseudomonas pseudopalustris]|uniref:Uncharacterized protein n=1 Tax=Rhodopseudomonas pseudopalustris TaxID=1513892 RepID=A0A1H8V9F6_9BRAD|nr:hypothetical protein [Rhodopseudomonas pseudopalustris]SEP12049.1 hypothetical protein SAMN05444123_108142 [Rhodopseudomonas pseudopalustris]
MNGRRTANLVFRIPLSGPEIWRAICQVADPQSKTFTAEDVAKYCETASTVISDYLRTLAKRGMVSRVTSRGTKFVITRDDTAPPFNPELQQLWTTMRTVQSFTAEELAYDSSTPDCSVSSAIAENYINRLIASGYVVQNKRRVGANSVAVYRLKPAMNSGPMAPTIVALSDVVFDLNTCTANLVEARVVVGHSRLSEGRI